MQRLMEDLGPRDGVLLYPEGTFFTPDAQARALAHLRASGPASFVEIAASLRQVLPPRLGGALGLLERNRGADAVFCAHTGFEGGDTFAVLLNGALVGRTIRVCFWRVPFREIPTDASARAVWLYEQWARVDDWITAAQREQCADPATARAGETHSGLASDGRDRRDGAVNGAA